MAGLARASFRRRDSHNGPGQNTWPRASRGSRHGQRRGMSPAAMRSEATARSGCQPLAPGSAPTVPRRVPKNYEVADQVKRSFHRRR